MIPPCRGMTLDAEPAIQETPELTEGRGSEPAAPAASAPTIVDSASTSSKMFLQFRDHSRCDDKAKVVWPSSEITSKNKGPARVVLLALVHLRVRTV